MQIKPNPKLRVLYLTLLLPLTAGIMSLSLARHAFYADTWTDRIIEIVLATLAFGFSVKTWFVTLEFANNMRQFIEISQAIKRGEYVLPSARPELPEIEDLAKELGEMDESPDTALSKWILFSRDHQAIFVRLVEAVAASIETKSFYARGHSGRVAEYATLICCELGVPREASMRIRLAALLHDIGKIGMDQSILTKPGGLTPEEFAILKTHPGRGVEMLQSVPQMADLLPGVELHHESLDGSGYPHGLVGDAIPMMARIISVADTFDAMTHNRTYQDAMDGAYALRLLRNMVGFKLDENVVAAFCRAYEAGLVVLPSRQDATEEEAWSNTAVLGA
jgi:HD-GYP domain-containing protein (c-di-GMP phosphodiesterase class II)